MNKFAGAAAIALATAFGSQMVSAQSTDLTALTESGDLCALPDPLPAELAATSTAEEVAAILLRVTDDLIPCVLEQADALGVATPSAVVASVISSTTPPQDRVAELIAFASEAETAGEIEVADTGATGGVLGDGGPAAGGNGTNIPSAAQNNPAAAASPN